MLQELLDDTFTALDVAVTDAKPAMQLQEVGRVVQVGNGIAKLTGLPGLTSEELVQFPGGILGIAVNLDVDEVGVILLGESDNLAAGAVGGQADRVGVGDLVGDNTAFRWHKDIDFIKIEFPVPICLAGDMPGAIAGGGRHINCFRFSTGDGIVEQQ